MDMNEEDALNMENAMGEGETEMQEPEESDTEAAETNTEAAETTQATKPRKRRLTSKVWKDFTSVGVESDGKERGQCNFCGKKLVINTRTHGTHHLGRHLESCPKKPKPVARPEYDHKIDREMTAGIIIYHDLPFRYAEYEKVRARNLYLNPDCQPISRQIAAADVYRRYEIEKEKLRDVFAKHQGRVCFTSDLWLARPTTMGYLCLTASFIDDNWMLHSKILAFCLLECPHTGEKIASTILEWLREWGLEKKVFSITLDNASNNGNMQRILKGQLQMMSASGLLCDGKFMHVRCCAHILNLIVKDGLDLAKNLLHDIRESVRFVKASQQRIQSFAACVERVCSKGGAGLSLDVPTRWNSTYGMLARALKFREAFKSMACFVDNET